MDEATPRIPQAFTRPQGLPPGAVLTEAKRLARNAVKAQYQARGAEVLHDAIERDCRGCQDISRRASGGASQPSRCKSHQLRAAEEALTGKAFRCAELMSKWRGHVHRIRQGQH